MGEGQERSEGQQAPPADASWDAGDQGCGELVLELRGRLLALPAGAVLRLRATDPGAEADIPAFCRLTGHALLRAAPPEFWIRRRAGGPPQE